MNPSPRIKNFLDTPFRTFFALWIPVLFSMVAEPLTGLVDTAFVARLGAEALAALGVGTVILTSGLWLFNFLSIGSQTEVSQACGRDNLDKGRRIGSLALLLAAVIGTFAATLAYIFAAELSTIMGASDSVRNHSVAYIQIRAFGGPAVLITMTCFGILYGLADMRSPLLVAVGVNGLNILLDWLLVFGIGPFPELGIGGAALASTISQWLGALCCVFVVQRKMSFTPRVKISDIRRLLKIGRDMFIRTGSLILFLLLATRSATLLGSDAGAAHQAIRQVWVFTNLFLDASAVTAQSIVGFYFGSGHIEDARKAAQKVCLWSIVIGVSLLIAMLIGTEFIAALLVPASGLLLYYPAWVTAALFQPVAALAFVTDGIHWGVGDFRFLRNVVLFATACGALSILVVDMTGTASLALLWWITGGWILIRAVFGMLRIWPRIAQSPLG